MNATSQASGGERNLLEKPEEIGAHPWTLFLATRRSDMRSVDIDQPTVLLIEAGTHSQHDARQSVLVGDEKTFLFTAYCKAEARHWVHLVLWAPELSHSGAQAWFDLATGTLGSAGLFGPGSSRISVSMEAVGNGWHLCRLGCRLDASAAGMQHVAQIQLGLADATPSYQGDGVSGLLVGRASLIALTTETPDLGESGDCFALTTMMATHHWPELPKLPAGLPGEMTDSPPEAKRLAWPSAVSLRSPDFPVRFPDLVNPELINFGSRHAMEQSWSRGRFAARQINFFRVPGAFVCDEGLVFDEDLRVIEQSTQYHSAAVIDRCRADIEARKNAGRIGYQSGPCVVVKRPASHNYYHYLAEMFSRAHIARNLLGSYRLHGRKPLYIVNRLGPTMLDTVYQSLRQIGIGLDQLLIMDNDPVQCEELFFVDGVTNHGGYMSPLVVGALESLAATVLPGPRRKLFVCRKSGGRLLANEDELAARMIEAGYVIIDPGSLSLQEQIAAFRGAEVVVGVLGAAMTNIAFCNPGTRVAVITAGSYPDTCFWFIAQHKRLPYLEVRCDHIDASAHVSGNWDFTIREQDIEMMMRF